MGENFRELVKNMIFAEKTFTNSHKTTKFMKTFFLESFPLYGSRLEPETNSNTQNNTHFLLCIKLRGIKLQFKNIFFTNPDKVTNFLYS